MVSAVQGKRSSRLVPHNPCKYLRISLNAEEFRPETACGGRRPDEARTIFRRQRLPTKVHAFGRRVRRRQLDASIFVSGRILKAGDDEVCHRFVRMRASRRRVPKSSAWDRSPRTSAAMSALSWWSRASFRRPRTRSGRRLGVPVQGAAGAGEAASQARVEAPRGHRVQTKIDASTAPRRQSE